MSFWGTYFAAMRRYGEFEGRSSRFEFFAYLGCTVVVVFASILIDRVLLRADGTGLVQILAILGHIIPTVAIAVRRLHDSDGPGALLFIGLIPYLGWFILFLFAIAAPSPLTNRYGSNPALVALSATAVSPAEELGRRAGRAVERFRLWLTSLRPVAPLPEPPESLAIELGVATKPSAGTTETAGQKKLRLQALRSSGMLSEAEFIRLTKELQ